MRITRVITAIIINSKIFPLDTALVCNKQIQKGCDLVYNNDELGETDMIKK